MPEVDKVRVLRWGGKIWHARSACRNLNSVMCGIAALGLVILLEAGCAHRELAATDNAAVEAAPATQILGSVQADVLAPLPAEIWAMAISKDNQHIALGERRQGKVVVSLDGKKGKAYDDVGRSSLVFSADGNHVAYFARTNRDWFLVLDGNEGTQFEDIGSNIGLGHGQGSPLFSPDGQHLAYPAKRGKTWIVVFDGQEQARYDLIEADRAVLLFSSESKHLAYCARRGNQWFTVVDGREGPAYSDMGSLQFSPDGKQVAYQAVPAKGEMRVVMNAQEQKPYAGFISPLVFSPNGNRYAYAAHISQDSGLPGREVRKDVVVVDGEEGKVYSYIDERSLVFSPDGRHIAYAAARGRKGFVVLDRHEELEYDGVVSPTFSPDGNHLAYYAATDGMWSVVVDGRHGKQYDGVSKHAPVFSPDGKHVAFFAKKNGHWITVMDGQEGHEYDDIGAGLEEGSPLFSPDGNRLAYSAMVGGNWFLVVDGRECEHFVAGFGFVFSPDSKHIIYDGSKSQRDCVMVDGGQGPFYDRLWSGPVFNKDGTMEYLVIENGMVLRIRQQLSSKPELVTGHEPEKRVMQPPAKSVESGPVVAAGQTTGGFSAEAQSTGLIVLHWNAFPNAGGYVVFRSTKPKFALDMTTVLTLDTHGDSPSPNQWADNHVVANTRYYYVIVPWKGDAGSIAATGSCATPASDGPLRGN